MEPRFTFNRIARLYDSARAGYPDGVFEQLSRFAAPGRSVLEIGCGTGKATVGLAARELTIVALDPGPAMIAEARRTVGDNADVRFVASTFEDWLPDASDFDLVAAAQAWHWVSPVIGFPKAASLLKPGGVLAIFGNDWTLVEPELREAVDAVYVRQAPELRDLPLGTWYRADGPLPATIEASGLYRGLDYEGFAWSRTADIETYLGMLRTLSNHQGLDPSRLDALMGAVGETARAFGTTVGLSYATHLHHCRRL